MVFVKNVVQWDVRSEGTHVLRLLVLVNNSVWLATDTRDSDGSNLKVESTRSLSSLSLLVRADSIVILLLASEAVLRSALLSLHAHEFLVSKRVGQTVLHNAVDELLVAVLGAGTQVGEVMGGIRHGFSAACDDDVRGSGHDGLRSENHGLERGSAHLVDGGADSGVGEAGTESTLSGWVLADTVVLEA